MKKHPNPGMFLFPLVGIGLFVVLYLLAAMNYPGGSRMFKDHEGFSFWHNYLCDLLDITAVNGEVNTARPYANAAMIVLCISLSWLWYYLPGMFRTKSLNRKIMRISGLLSLLIIVFLGLGNHDKIVRIAGFFGVIAFISCSIALFKAGQRNLFLFGILCLTVFLINYFIYETGIYLRSLPFIQKVTFLLFISWFIGLDITLYQNVVLKKEPATVENS
ncbi:MAG: hypothetical protein KJN76_10545 [Eudoraea sp.]|nr:hypothetical protein [Eudoraea sp.]